MTFKGLSELWKHVLVSQKQLYETVLESTEEQYRFPHVN